MFCSVLISHTSTYTTTLNLTLTFILKNENEMLGIYSQFLFKLPDCLMCNVIEFTNYCNFEEKNIYPV